MFYSIALMAYIIDFMFSEFSKISFIHPIVLMGKYIKWFENVFYKDSVLRGAFLCCSLLLIVFFITYLLSFIDNILFLALIASFSISHKMLYQSVKDVILCDEITTKRDKISMLVSRDTKNMSEEEINKACIETYAENLSDGVIAPIFYLMCFGIVGAFLYKAINTLDSMVGYRNNRYEKYGKFSARVDDIVNFIPSRITAVIIALLYFSKKALFQFYNFGKKHESLNAGMPISAMALSINVKLGGPTSYFGKIKDKPYFGDGKDCIKSSDVKNALALKNRLDIFIVIILILGVVI